MSEQAQQLQFNFAQAESAAEQIFDPLLDRPDDSSGRGYDAFQFAQAEAIRSLEHRFGVLLNQRVRIKLIGWDEEFEGTLRLAQLPRAATRKAELQLRIESVTFTGADIERCIRA